jgi:hypothetical protein
MDFTKYTVNLIGDLQRDTAIAKLKNIPLGKGLQVVFQKEVKARTPDQNSLMWSSGCLTCIAEQFFVEGKLYSAEVWHEHFKREYLPELDEPYLFELVKKPDTYRKWDYLPNGDRVLVGSTTDLTKYGFGIYIEKIYAEASSAGVMFDQRIAA